MLSSDISATRAEIEKLLQKGAIESCLPVQGQFLSSFFLVDKPDGSKRFIINLKN